MTEEEYLLEIVANQQRIYGYIKSIHPYPSEVEDILQESNMTLMKKYKDFDCSRDFMPWAFSIARWTWMAYKQKRRRALSKLSYLDEEFNLFVDPQTCDHEKRKSEEYDRKKLILNKAYKKLSKQEKNMLSMAFDGKELDQMAKELNLGKNCLSTRKSRLLSKLKKIVRYEQALLK